MYHFLLRQFFHSKNFFMLFFYSYQLQIGDFFVRNNFQCSHFSIHTIFQCEDFSVGTIFYCDDFSIQSIFWWSKFSIHTIFSCAVFFVPTIFTMSWFFQSCHYLKWRFHRSYFLWNNLMLSYNFREKRMNEELSHWYERKNRHSKKCNALKKRHLKKFINGKIALKKWYKPKKCTPWWIETKK